MVTARRSEDNPILSPNKAAIWEKEATFNGCVVKEGGNYHLLYRAQGAPQQYANVRISLSTIGYAKSHDGVHFSGRRQFIKPEFDWERFGCEDPRVSQFEGKYYIFYTALSVYPFSSEGIKVACAVTDDFSGIREKHQVTTFNSKAFALFPERINGKITAILTANTDKPPAKISIASFDKTEEIWSKSYWNDFYTGLEKQSLTLQRSRNDHVEIGAPPISTHEGWLLIYSYIYNYFIGHPTFAIEAVLLKKDDPKQVIARSRQPLIVPEKHYELYGKVPNIVFPTGTIVSGEDLIIYYGAADTTVCLAKINLEELLKDLLPQSQGIPVFNTKNLIPVERFSANPIITSKKENKWEDKFTFNPGALYLCDRINLLYRAMGRDDTSVLGYASTKDGFNIDERLTFPVYEPREGFEKKSRPGNSGCEDARLVNIEDKVYMCYTAYNGADPPRVALTSIKTTDFCQKNWQWEKPILISPPNIDDKDATLFPEKINGKFVFLHRFNPNIWIDYIDDLSFSKSKFLNGEILLEPRVYSWDSDKIGIGPPPIKTASGWLLIYHGLSRYSLKYRLGAALLATDNPSQVLARLDYPILEPETEHEKKGVRPDTVFSCGVCVIEDNLYVYYGGGDQVIGAARLSLSKLLEELRKYHI